MGRILADGEVTDDEIDQLCRAAALLDLDVEFVTSTPMPTEPSETPSL